MKMNELIDRFPAGSVTVHGSRVTVQSDGDQINYILGCDGELWLVEGIATNPPLGQFPVKNLYVNAAGKLVVEWDNAP